MSQKCSHFLISTYRNRSYGKIYLHVFFTAAVLILGLVSPRTARSGALTIVQQACDALDQVEIERLIAIELNNNEDDTSIEVTLLCDNNTLRIITVVKNQSSNLNDSSNVFERSVDLEESQLRERLIALTVTQMLTLKDSKPIPSIAPSVKNETAFSETAQPHHDQKPETSLSLGGGVKSHAKFSILTGYGSIRGDLFITKLTILGLIFSIEGARHYKVLGNVSILCGLVGIVVSRNILSFQYVDISLSTAALLGYTRLSGNPNTDKGGSTIDGVAGELQLGAGPVFKIGRLIAAIELFAGYTFRNPVGTVESDSSVSLGGFLVGGGLRLGIHN